MAKSLPILLYHEFHADFKGHLDVIAELGYRTAHLSEVKDYLLSPRSTPYLEKTIVLTFDDALLDFFKSQWPLLKEFGFTATVCVATGYVSDDANSRRLNCWPNGPGLPTMNWDELSVLVEQGIEIVSHSVNHIPFIDDRMEGHIKRRRYELKRSKDVLEQRLDSTISFFAFPGGAGWGRDDTEALLTEEGYKGALRAEFDSGDKWDRYTIPRWEPHEPSDFIDILEQIDRYEE